VVPTVGTVPVPGNYLFTDIVGRYLLLILSFHYPGGAVSFFLVKSISPPFPSEVKFVSFHRGSGNLTESTLLLPTWTGSISIASGETLIYINANITYEPPQR